MILENERKLNTRISIGILLLVCIICLIPFLDKAFNIDDPLFIWVAKQIQAHPADFYGFSVNWNGFEMPMWTRTQNPPLTSYYIALAAYWVGWSEIALHLVFLVPAIAVVIGTYLLARELCQRPLVATLISILTPVFLVSSTTVMCDTLMLSFWVWSVFLWLNGIKRNSTISLICASFLIAACSLTKYFGMSLIPLLFIYSLAKQRKLGYWTLFLLIPVLILAAYQWVTFTLYGTGLLLQGFSYSASYRQSPHINYFAKALTGLVFVGGCLISLLFYVPLLWRKRILAMCALFTLFYMVSLPFLRTIGNFEISTGEGVKWLSVVEFSLLSLAGANFVALVVYDLWGNRNTDSLLLFLWSIGTLIFTCFLNWSINGRSILPLVPVLGIVIMRHFDRSGALDHVRASWRILLPLVPAAIIALGVTWADYIYADSARSAAVQINNTYKNASGTLWFQGHWGFQYYMEKLGGKAIDAGHPALAEGDLVIIPSNVSRIFPMRQDRMFLLSEYRFPMYTYITTQNEDAGAGFYSDVFGPFPFVIGYKTVEKYTVYLLHK